MLYHATGWIIGHAHTAAQRIGTFAARAILPPAVETEERDQGYDQWAAYQAHCKALREKARRNHAPVRHIDEQQRAVVHAALKGGA